MRVMDLDGLSDKNGRAETSKMTFRGTDGTGRHFYVHMSRLDQITYDPQLAWIGTAKQGLNVRAKFPHSRLIPLIRQQHKKSSR